MQPSPEDTRRSFRDATTRRLYAELYCLFLTFWFHDDNSHPRKAATLLIVLVWGVIEVGGAFGYANLPDQFFILRLVIGAIIGRMWGIEINNFAGVELNYSDGDEGGDDGDE